MTRYQQNNSHIQELRQRILTDIQQLIAGSDSANRIDLIEDDDYCPIVTMETETDCINVQPTSILIDKNGQLVFNMQNADCPDQTFLSIGGENLYLEGLNDLLDAVESKIAPL